MPHEPQSTSDTSPPTRFWEKIGLVAEISLLCRRMTSTRPAFGDVLQVIQRMIPFDAASLYLHNPDNGQIEVSASLHDTVRIPGFLEASDPTTGRKQLSDRSALVSLDDPAFSGDSDYAVVLYAPLIVDHTAIGALMAGVTSPGVLQEQHLKLMSIVADQLAVSIERMNYIATIETKNEELHLAQEELRANQRKIVAAEKLAAAARMAASINHQINNPLAVILGHVQCLLLEQHDVGAKALQRLNRIEQAAKRIANVNQRLLKIDAVDSDPTRIEQELMEAIPQPNDPY